MLKSSQFSPKPVFRVLLSLGFYFSFGLVLASKPAEPKTENLMMTLVPAPAPAAAAASKIDEANKTVKSLDDVSRSAGKSKLNLLVTAGRQNYNLRSASGGLDVNMGSMAYNSYGISYLRPIDEVRRNFMGYSQSSSSQASPLRMNSNTLFYSPSIFNSKTYELFWETQEFLSFQHPGWKKNLYWSFGVELNHRWADITYPNYLMTNRSMAGLRFGLGYEKQWKKNWVYEFKGLVFLPVYFQEHQQQTGAFNWMFAPDLSSMATYQVSDTIDFSFGFQYRVEQIFFNGAGTRGSLNAKETFQRFIIPVELRFKI